MERWAPHTPQLDVRSHFNLTLNTSAAAETPWTAQNGTRSLIASLQLAQVQQLRTMHLTLGAFSLALTLITVYLILSDARKVAAVQVTLRRHSFSSLRNVHPAETFPLVLACGAVIQQIIFVSVQGASLRSILSDQCRGIAMITFPGIFILGYITLIFGIEMAMRACSSFRRFAPRGKWNTTICIGVTSFLVLLTWMPTIAWPMYNRCFGSLIFFAFRYEVIAISVLSILIFSFLGLAALITIQLMRTPGVDPNERIAASRMCYYLILAAVIYIMVLPLEIQALRRDFMNALATSRVAEVSLFSSGMVIAFLHLFLRANATRMVIKPIEEMRAQSKQKRPKIRLFGPSDLELQISGPLALQGGHRPDSRQGLIDVGPEKNRYDFEPGYFVRPEKPLSPVSMKSQALIDSSKWPLPPDPVQTGFASEPKEVSSGLHQRNKSNYSLFPTRAEDIPRLPATVYKPPKAGDDNSRLSKLAVRRQTRRSSLGDTKSVTDVSEAFSFLAKPMPLFSKHRRGESTDSSATVQIGLRFSVAPATLAAAKCTRVEREVEPSSPPPLVRDNSESSGVSLGLPIQAPSRGPTPSGPKDPAPSAFPSPPRNVSPTPGKTPAFPVLSAQNSGAYLQAQREKVLPPTPRSAMPTPPPQAQAPTQMSGLRMNPVTPAASVSSPTSSSPVSTPTTPLSGIKSNNLKSTTALSPTSRIPLGAGTMARSPPPNGWI